MLDKFNFYIVILRVNKKSIIGEFVSATTMKWEDCPNVKNKNGLKADDAPWSIYIKFVSQTESNQEVICSGTHTCISLIHTVLTIPQIIHPYFDE